MKLRYNILVCALAALMVVACTKDKVLDFQTDIKTIEVGASGGVKKVKIQSSDEWVASVGMQSNGDPNPWIAVSPANGRGSVDCEFIIDEALQSKPSR